MVRIYIIGITILLVAIIANGVAKYLGFLTWYDFIESFSEQSSKNFSILNYLWLFIIYPLILGLGYLLGDSVSNLFKL